MARKGGISLEDLFSITINQTNQSHMMTNMAQATLDGIQTEEQPEPRRGGGSRPGKTPNMDRSHLEGHENLMRDYFVNGPKCFSAQKFRRRFRMNRPLFLRIVDAVTAQDPYFVQKADAVGRLGLSSLQKCTSAIRMLAYGTPADLQDEYLRLSETTALESLERFCKAVIHCFSAEYRREPTQSDIDKLLKESAERGFPGAIGSIDCMHWPWKNCPKALAGQYKGKEDSPTLILEAVASHNLWIWHSFFGLPGSLNDINVLHKSPIFQRLAKGLAPECKFSISGRDFNMGYYLADGIYPKWATLVQTISHPQDRKKKLFAKMQEAFRKDVERAFGVLQARFGIVAHPGRFWSADMMRLIMETCIILHNMIVEDETTDMLFDMEPVVPRVEVERGGAAVVPYAEYMERHVMYRDSTAHYELQASLVEHLWAHFGST